MSAEAQRRYRERHPEKAAEVNRRYYSTPKGRAKREEIRTRFRNAHLDQEHANGAVQRAVRKGKLTKGSCAVCGAPPTQTHGHHYLGYDPKHHLDVVWLCPRHHREAHVLLASAKP